MIADYSAKVKIAIFQSIWKRQRDEWRSSSNCRRITAKIARFNSINSEITGRKFTKIGHDVAWLLPLKLLKVDLRSANPFQIPKQRVKVVPRDVCEHLPYLTGCHSNVPSATAKRIFGKSSTLICLPTCKVRQGGSRTFWDIWRDMPIFAVSPQKVLLLTA